MNKSLRICTVGGGSGMPIVNKALVKAGFTNISSIVTTFDSGGDSGRMRTDERGNLLAFSDYWRALMSLWEDGEQKKNWEEMLRFRDGRGRNFGNTFFRFMSEKSGTLLDVDALFSSLVGAKLCGEVVPVSIEPAELCFRTESGKEYKGEHRLDELRMSLDRVTKIWLEPEVKASDQALRDLMEAEVIIVCPGSMYGSVLTNFLPKGMVGAYNKSKAKKILMTNIMTTANENNGFCQNDYVKVFSKCLKNESPFSKVLMPDLSKLNKKDLDESFENYRMEHSKEVSYCKESLVDTVLEDIAVIEEKNRRLRHDVAKMAKVFSKMLR